MTTLHERRFPNESDEYRLARNELLAAEVALRDQLEAVATMRSTLPSGGAVNEDYEFDEVDASGELKQTRLSELFQNGNSLLVYGFMYGPDWDSPCPSCTSITDASNGQAEHLGAATNFVVVAKAPIEKLRALAVERGWNQVRFLSSSKSTFNADYFAEPKPNEHHPMINVFRKDGEVVKHSWASETFFVARDGHPRHADLLWPLWNWLDLTPEGRGDFMPKLLY
jgi:predicted dithiol-disulfide oxidoreductase (DUF899 family)